MPLPSADRVQLAYIPEATFGVTPTTGNGYNLRTTGETLQFNLTKETDKELNANAENTSSTTTGAQADGDIKGHMQYAEYDRLFAGLMRSAWSAYGTNGVGSTFSASVTAGTLGTVASVITAGAAPINANAFTTLAPGQWFKVNMPGDPNDGKLARVSLTVAPTPTTVTCDVNTPLTAATAVAGSSLSTSRLKNGVTMQSFTIERQISEIGQYMAYRGLYVSKFSTQFASKSITDVTFTTLGKDMIKGGATTLPGTTAASQTYDIQNGVTGVANIWENGAPLAGTTIKSMKFDIDSGLRAQDGLGVLGLVGVGIGTFAVTGTLEVYFANGALFDKYANDVYTSICLTTKDSLGNGYVISLPRVMLTKASVNAGGRNTDLMASFEFTAYADKANANAALRATMFLDRFGAAVTP
jgi:hypothetical protein